MTALLQLKVSVEAGQSKQTRIFIGLSRRNFLCCQHKLRVQFLSLSARRAGSVGASEFLAEAGRVHPVSAIAEAATTRSMMPSTSSRSHLPSDNFVSRSLSRMV